MLFCRIVFRFVLLGIQQFQQEHSVSVTAPIPDSPRDKKTGDIKHQQTLGPKEGEEKGIAIAQVPQLDNVKHTDEKVAVGEEDKHTRYQ